MTTWRAADLTGRVALVTGASRGLGSLLARELADQGCRLAVCARDQVDLDRVADGLRASDAEVLAESCDVSRRGEAEGFVQHALSEFGTIDILVNCAGGLSVGPLSAMRVEDFEESLGAVFWGSVYTSLAVLPVMRANGGGRIVNITSASGRLSMPHLLPYSAAKFALTGFSQGLRTEAAAYGISVTTVTPGTMRTGSHLRASYKGDQDGEFSWFARGASMPVATMDARRAARRIVRAARRGRAELILPLPTKLMLRTTAVLPGLGRLVLSRVDKALPHGEAPETALGIDVRERLPGLDRSRPIRRGDRIANQLGQIRTGTARTTHTEKE